MGCMDTKGMIRITGRYKELIIGSGGENIAPVPIEDEIKKRCAAISNVMMVGDKRKFNTCLVTLKAKGATGEQPGGDELDGPQRASWLASPPFLARRPRKSIVQKSRKRSKGPTITR